MSSSSGANDRRYNLRSNSHNSRPVEKVCSGKVTLSQKKRKRAVKPEEDREDIVFRKFPEYERSTRKFAVAALSYLREKGDNFELVKPGLYQGATISGGTLLHLNFKAKRADDPSVPVNTFFAQVFIPGYTPEKDLKVDCCVSLGESDTLPMERDNRGCNFCSDGVYHPVGGCEGIKMGWPTWLSEKLSKKYGHPVGRK